MEDALKLVSDETEQDIKDTIMDWDGVTLVGNADGEKLIGVENEADKQKIQARLNAYAIYALNSTVTVVGPIQDMGDDE